MVLITIVTGAYKSTYILGASHCTITMKITMKISIKITMKINTTITVTIMGHTIHGVNGKYYNNRFTWR